MILGALRKNYKLLRELEDSLDRQQALNKHLGLQKGKLFAAFTRQVPRKKRIGLCVSHCLNCKATTENLKLSCKFSVIPEAFNEDALKVWLFSFFVLSKCA